MKGEVVVRIIDETKQGDNKTAINTKTGKNKQDVDKEENRDFSLEMSVVVNQAYNYAKNAVISQAQYQITKHFNMTDDFEGQRDLNITLGIANKMKNIALTTLAGAQVGGVPGAIVGFVGSVGMEALSVYQRYDEQARSNALKRAQLDYTRQRAGYSLTGESYK